MTLRCLRRDPAPQRAGYAAPTLRGIVKELTQANRSFEILFVDDGSSDGSFAVLEELAAADARVGIIRFRGNFGKAAASMPASAVSRVASS